jgi:hypothetical protein
LVIIQDILISDDLFETYFVCNLSRCKGACCWEGDFGAPLSRSEVSKLPEVYSVIEDFLSASSKKVLQEQGLSTFYDEPKYDGTPLHLDGRCAYLIVDELGIAKCSIEKAFEEGLTDFQKPISCHLYPIRMKENELTGFAAMNYDQWDICSDACQLGEELKMPLFRFVQQAIIRKYGQSFFEEMDKYYERYYHLEAQ